MKNPVLEQVVVTFHVVLYFWNVKFFFFFANKILVLLHPKTNCYTCSGSLTVKLNVEINVLIANLFCQNKPLVRIKK